MRETSYFQVHVRWFGSLASSERRLRNVEAFKRSQVIELSAVAKSVRTLDKDSSARFGAAWGRLLVSLGCTAKGLITWIFVRCRSALSTKGCGAF